MFCSLLMLQWKSDLDKAVQIVQSALDIDPLCEYAYEILGTICVQKSVSCLFCSLLLSLCQNQCLWLLSLCQNLLLWLLSVSELVLMAAVCVSEPVLLATDCQKLFLWLQSVCQNWFLWLRFRSGGIGVL